MARNDYYTIREETHAFVVTKMDPTDHTPRTEGGPQNLPTQYHIGKEAGNLAMCTCFAGHKWCRHKQMLVEFQSTNRLNQRWLYNFDKKHWIPPLQQEL